MAELFTAIDDPLKLSDHRLNAAREAPWPIERNTASPQSECVGRAPTTNRFTSTRQQVHRLLLQGQRCGADQTSVGAERSWSQRAAQDLR
jgi:hypothetical protein